MKDRSENGGIAMSFVISEEFHNLVNERTAEEDPSFITMSDPFWKHGEDAIGKYKLCPRDYERGCALIDTRPPEQRQEATHFLSWVWGYKLSTVVSGTKRWALTYNQKADKIFFFACFFCNNQFRIIVEG